MKTIEKITKLTKPYFHKKQKEVDITSVLNYVLDNKNKEFENDLKIEINLWWEYIITTEYEWYENIEWLLLLSYQIEYYTEEQLQDLLKILLELKE